MTDSQANSVSSVSFEDPAFAQTTAAHSNKTPQADAKNSAAGAQSRQTNACKGRTTGPDAVSDNPPDVNDTDNTLGIRFIKHLASDQKAIWTSPFHLRWGDTTWLVRRWSNRGSLNHG